MGADVETMPSDNDQCNSSDEDEVFLGEDGDHRVLDDLEGAAPLLMLVSLEI